jgi:hypothetical protein
MKSVGVVQVVSTFSSAALEPAFLAALAGQDISARVAFTQYTQISEYLLSAAANSPQTLGTLIVLRLEDWLREEIGSVPEGASTEAWVREQIRARADEFVSQLSTLAHGERHVWFLPCPSNGWIADHYKLATLCRTYTNLVSTRVRNLAQVTSLAWPTSLTSAGVNDLAGDQREQAPFTQAGFEELGSFAGAQIAKALAKETPRSLASGSGSSTALAAYLAGLELKVQLSHATPQDRPHIDRLLRATSSFSLTGEKPLLQDDELTELLRDQVCLLIRVSDRSADYGVAGLVFLHSEQNAMIVTGFALSCTVLGKQVEFAVLSALAQQAVDGEISTLVFEFVPTRRNQSILSFLQTVADHQPEMHFTLPIEAVKARIESAAINPAAWALTQPNDLLPR